MCRVKIPLPLPLPHVDYRKKFIEDVDEDSRYAIDAAIVKRWRERKHWDINNLFLSVSSNLAGCSRLILKRLKYVLRI